MAKQFTVHVYYDYYPYTCFHGYCHGLTIITVSTVGNSVRVTVVV